MLRINTPSAVPDKNGAGKPGFQDGNLAIGQLPTSLNALFFNNLQEEIANVVEAAGIALNGGVQIQLLQAIQALITSRFAGSHQLLAQAGFQELPGGFIMQWGLTSSNTSGVAQLTFPIAFPSAMFIVLGIHIGGDTAVVSEIGNSRTLTGVQLLVKNLSADGQAWSVAYFAIGR